MSVPINEGNVDGSTCPFRSSVYQRSTTTTSPSSNPAASSTSSRHGTLDQRHDVRQFTSSLRKLWAGPTVEGSGGMHARQGGRRPRRASGPPAGAAEH